MNADQNKICPCCAENIKLAAKVCPRCRQCLSLRSLRHPITGMLFLTIPLVVIFPLAFFGLVSKFDHIFNPKPHYTDYIGSLRITESRMNLVNSTNGIRIYLVGILTNQSQITWKDVEFDCRFFDDRGTLVDAQSGLARFTVEPNNDSAFRVSIVPSRPTNEYASFKISVSTARNDDSFL
jgi:hypothetical protein